MKFYGHADMQKNQLQNAALQTLTQFPALPVVGQIAFVNSIVYICVANDPAPAVWVAKRFAPCPPSAARSPPLPTQNAPPPSL